MKIRSLTFPIITFTSIILTGTQANADTTWMKKVKPFNEGFHPKIKPTKLEYEMSWKGTVKAGSLIFEFNKKDKRYKVGHSI
jgi:hypothetical protein